MKKFLLISDNHGDLDVVKKILKAEDYDISVHLGDSEAQEDVIKGMFTHYVGGNHDWYSIVEDKFEYEGLKFIALHGHTRNIYLLDSITPSYELAVSEKVDVVLHGHTHIPKVTEMGGKLIICPGSVTIPRANSVKQYVTFEVENGKIRNLKNKFVSDL